MAPLALLFALVAQPAAAPPAPAAPAVPPGWRSLGVAGNGRDTYYDPASIVRAGPITRVQLRFNEETDYVLSTLELRCATFEGRAVGMITYNPDGTEANRNEMSTPFRAIIVGSFLEALSREVCGAAQGPASPQ